MADSEVAARTSGSGYPLTGRIGGAMLSALRRRVPVTQEAFAERLGVSPATEQAWEQARKPLVNVSYARLRAIRRELLAYGIAPALLDLWDKALDADLIWSELGTADPDRHPLALTVPDREITELLAWPLSGQPPRQLADSRSTLLAGSGELAVISAALRVVADRGNADDEKPAMLRRQAKFLLARTDDAAASEWAADAEIRDLRSPGISYRWTPRWPLARSAAIAAANAGDLDPLHRFVETGLADDEMVSANLNYWAYWAGEYPAQWGGDSAMTRDGADWTGQRLLNTLLAGIVHAPYRDLCACTLWALLRSRRTLAFASQSRIRQSVAMALGSDELASFAKRRLEEINYLMEYR